MTYSGRGAVMMVKQLNNYNQGGEGSKPLPCPAGDRRVLNSKKRQRIHIGGGDRP